MSWGCCTPDGRCQQGHGCPAGASDKDACRSAREMRIARVARIGKRRPALHSVDLDKAERQTRRKGLGRWLVNWIEAVLLMAAIGLVVHAIDPTPQFTAGAGHSSGVAR